MQIITRLTGLDSVKVIFVVVVLYVMIFFTLFDIPALIKGSPNGTEINVKNVPKDSIESINPLINSDSLVPIERAHKQKRAIPETPIEAHRLQVEIDSIDPVERVHQQKKAAAKAQIEPLKQIEDRVKLVSIERVHNRNKNAPKEENAEEKQEKYVDDTPVDEIEFYEQNNEKNLIKNQVKSALFEKQQAEDDKKKLINLNDFEYLINQPSCAEFERERRNDMNEIKKPLLTVILVHSAPNNKEKRKAVRETWGHEDHRSRLFFLLGAVNSTSLQDKLFDEDEQYHDLIQGNFIDIYHNMTYKHVMALKWFKDNCPKVKFLLRTDDDSIIDINSVYSLMEVELKQSDKLIVCQNWVNARVLRTNSKWMVTKDEYAEEYFPPYCAGHTIIYTNDVVPRLFQEALKTSYFWIDDVHVTGILRTRLKNVSIKSFEDFFYHNMGNIDDMQKRKMQIDDIKPKYIFIQFDLRVDKMRKLWNIIKDQLI